MSNKTGIATKSYLIDPEGKLWNALEKQLRLTPTQTDFSFPDPTIAIIKNSLYFVAIELDTDGLPSLCFWKINGKEIASEATFKIDRAELLLDCTELGDITYMTNAALL